MKDILSLKNDIINDIIEVGKLLYFKDFVASNDGNISVKLDDGNILITPSGVSKGRMKAEDFIVVSPNGTIVEGNKKPSSEMKMHLRVYERRRDVRAVVHAHPQNTTAFSAVKGMVIEKILLPEVIFTLGNIRVAEYGTPTTPDLPDTINGVICDADAIILRNHGALTVGTDVLDAYFKMETLEHYCAIRLKTMSIGEEAFIDETEMAKLYSIRETVYGKKMPACNVLATDNTPGNIKKDNISLEMVIEEIVTNIITEICNK